MHIAQRSTLAQLHSLKRRKTQRKFQQNYQKDLFVDKRFITLKAGKRTYNLSYKRGTLVHAELVIEYKCLGIWQLEQL